MTIGNNDGKLSFAPANDSREADGALAGTIRQLVNNMVKGVTEGFEEADADWRGLQDRCTGSS